jgi:ribosomal protein S21
MYIGTFPYNDSEATARFLYKRIFDQLGFFDTFRKRLFFHRTMTEKEKKKKEEERRKNEGRKKRKREK